MEISLTKLPNFRLASVIVATYDKIRFNLDSKSDEYSEFSWYAREFPRYYRYHLDNIQFRIASIHNLYSLHINEFEIDKEKDFGGRLFGSGISTRHSFQIYWEF